MTGTASNSPPIDASVAEKVRRRTMVQRRRRVLLHLAAFIAVSIGMLYVVLWQRDDHAMRSITDISRAAAAAMQKQFDQSGVPPAEFPDLGKQYSRAAARYVMNIAYAQQLSRHKQVVVLVTARVHRFLAADGHSLVLFDGREFTERWLTVDELRANASEWGVALDGPKPNP